MGAVATAGASLRPRWHWHQMNWRRAHRNVRRLQIRIVQAQQEGKWRKVRALQHILTRSWSGRAVAVQRVTTNRGKHTPGVDHVIWDTPDKKAQAVADLQHRGGSPLPLRRIAIPKRNGGTRYLGIPTMRDRARQALHLLALDPIAETQADPNSYGFRPGRSAADAIGQCYCVLSHKTSAPWVLEGDIKACFDGISHDWLLAKIPMDKAILQSWLKAGYVAEDKWHPTEAGTPQGGIISPVLANLTLDGLERVVKARWASTKTLQCRNQVHLIRYADDFIITGRTAELLVEEVKPAVEDFLRERGLELSATKTHITHISQGFDFLGQTIRKYGGKFLTRPSTEECQSPPGQGASHDQSPATGPGRGCNPATQPVDPGMGELSPAWRQCTHLCESGLAHRADVVALGETQTPQEECGVGRAEILPTQQHPTTGVHRQETKPCWGSPAHPPVPGPRDRDDTTHQDQRGGESV